MAPDAPPGLLRVALVGCGEVCEHKHLPALRHLRGVTVTAVADRDPRRAAHVGDRFAIPNRFADVRALLDAGVPDVIGVLTPPGEHAAVALAALEAGCHVLIEKPLSLSLDDADALAAADRLWRGRMVMGLHMRWHRLVQRARGAIREGALGTVESIRVVWSSPRGDAGIPAWKQTRSRGGGALVELGVHAFDLWRFLGSAEVTEVSAFTRAGVRDDESAVVSARLENGALATAVLSERSSHAIEIDVAGDRGRIHVSGQRFDGFEHYALSETNGMFGPRLRHLARAVRELPRGLALMRRLGDYGDSYRAEWQHVADVAAGAVPACTVDDGRAALRVVLAAAASAEYGAPVRVNDAPRALSEVLTDA